MKLVFLVFVVAIFVGKHQVLFFNDGETIEITHTAHSRTIFAEGALKAADFLVKQKPGLYHMDHLLK